MSLLSDRVSLKQIVRVKCYLLMLHGLRSPRKSFKDSIRMGSYFTCIIQLQGIRVVKPTTHGQEPVSNACSPELPRESFCASSGDFAIGWAYMQNYWRPDSTTWLIVAYQTQHQQFSVEVSPIGTTKHVVYGYLAIIIFSLSL